MAILDDPLTKSLLTGEITTQTSLWAPFHQYHKSGLSVSGRNSL